MSVVHVDRRSDECLDEIEDCWQLRDAGYHTIWASEVRSERNDGIAKERTVLWWEGPL